MKLYYAPGACSLSPHIVAREAGIDLELIRVDIRATPHRTETGAEFDGVTPKAYVPALELDDGEVLTEGVAIVQFLADSAPETGLAPPPGSFERYRLLEWLNFISSELHKTFNPLFHPEYGEAAAALAREKLAERFAYLDTHLSTASFLMGDRFSIADAYCFTVAGWSKFVRYDLSAYPELGAYLNRIAVRPKVQEALRAEGLLVAAS